MQQKLAEVSASLYYYAKLNVPSSLIEKQKNRTCTPRL